MRTIIVQSLLASLAAGLAVAPSNAVSYTGYKVLRVNTLGSLVKEKLATLSFEKWEDTDTHVDIVVSPDQFEKLSTLGLNYRTLHQDLGQSIDAEKKVKSFNKRDVNDLSWYDSYHPYEDHVRYFEDLHAAFPDNSELVSSGRSYENRSIHGIHLFGDGGPGKPAVLYQ